MVFQGLFVCCIFRIVLLLLLLLLFQVAFPLWHIALPAYYVGVSQAVGLYLLNSVVSSYWFALQFAPTHISTDAEFPQDPMSLAQTRDWATLQVCPDLVFVSLRSFSGA